VKPLDRDEGILLIRSFLRETLQPFVMAGLHGSVARNEAKPESDVDVILILNPVQTERIEREHLIYAGRRLQIIRGAAYHFRERFAKIAKSGDNFMATIFVKGVFADGDINLFQRLQMEAQEVEDRGPTPPSTDELAGLAMRIYDSIEKLAYHGTPDQRMHIAFHVMRHFGVFLCRQHQTWLHTGASQYTQISGLEPKLLDSATEALRSGIWQDNYCGFGDILCRYLRSHGYEAWHTDARVRM